MSPIMKMFREKECKCETLGQTLASLSPGMTTPLFLERLERKRHPCGLSRQGRPST